MTHCVCNVLTAVKRPIVPTVIVLNELVPRLVRHVLECTNLAKALKELLQFACPDAVVGQDGQDGRLHGGAVGIGRKLNLHGPAMQRAAVKLAHRQAGSADVVV